MELQRREVKNWVMKKTETRLPVQRPTEASVSVSFVRPVLRKNPSTILRRNGVHRFAERSSDSIA
jgi:hypothetical protein